MTSHSGHLLELRQSKCCVEVSCLEWTFQRELKGFSVTISLRKFSHSLIRDTHHFFLVKFIHFTGTAFVFLPLHQPPIHFLSLDMLVHLFLCMFVVVFFFSLYISHITSPCIWHSDYISLSQPFLRLYAATYGTYNNLSILPLPASVGHIDLRFEERCGLATALLVCKSVSECICMLMRACVC